MFRQSTAAIDDGEGALRLLVKSMAAAAVLPTLKSDCVMERPSPAKPIHECVIMHRKMQRRLAKSMKRDRPNAGYRIRHGLAGRPNMVGDELTHQAGHRHALAVEADGDQQARRRRMEMRDEIPRQRHPA